MVILNFLVRRHLHYPVRQSILTEQDRPKRSLRIRPDLTAQNHPVLKPEPAGVLACAGVGNQSHIPNDSIGTDAIERNMARFLLRDWVQAYVAEQNGAAATGEDASAMDNAEYVDEVAAR